jgi:hypothetical protein
MMTVFTATPTAIVMTIVIKLKRSRCQRKQKPVAKREKKWRVTAAARGQVKEVLTMEVTATAKAALTLWICRYLYCSITDTGHYKREGRSVKKDDAVAVLHLDNADTSYPGTALPVVGNTWSEKKTEKKKIYEKSALSV